MQNTKYNNVFEKLEEIVQNMKRGIVFGAYHTSEPILKLILRFVQREYFNSPAELMTTLRKMGKVVQMGRQSELASVNVIRRVMFLAREVEKTVLEDEESEVQTNELHRLISEKSVHEKVDMTKYKDALCESILEFQQELKSLYENIAEQGECYINDNDIVLLFGKSKTVMEFVCGAQKTKKFNIIVINSTQHNNGEEILKELKEHNIQAHLFSESSLFSILSRVNKIILGCHAVLANGGLIATAGTFNLCSAATHYHIPVYVCTGTYKICPLFPTDNFDFSLLQSPLPITPSILTNPSILSITTGLDQVFEEKKEKSKGGEVQIEAANYIRVINPSYDYIQPEWINLFITNEQGVSPSYIYRLLAQLYNPDDTFFTD
ncbi:Translation initiation factor eIF2B subunit beta [Entamoeba marina]